MGDQTESFGELLRRYRVEAALTQEVLAERAGLSRRGIADLERGVRRRPYKHTLIRLADGLQLESAQRSALLSAGQQARTRQSPRATRTIPARAAVEEPLTAFIGRQRELGEVRRLLATTWLLTLIGMGGVGKTRLALQAALHSSADYSDGVRTVELAALTLPEHVGRAIAFSVGIAEERTDSVADTLVAELRSKSMLLVLDNCEHLIDACAELAHTLVRSCPGLRILATSREPLSVQGETTWTVPPLAVAAPEAPLAEQTGSDAAHLFIERVKAARPDLVLDERNTPAILDICRALGGIPLALELAAARLRAMEPEEVRARLGQALALLQGGSRTAPHRQRTMRAALDWSYALLSENEQHLFADLAVFAGGWDLDAVEAICAAAPDVLNVMTSLVDKSLISVERHDGYSRYRFLEPVRQYAHERLEARGDMQAVRRRHALHYAQVAEDAALEAKAQHLITRLDRLEREHDNFRAALQTSIQHHDGEAALRLAAGLHWFWLLRGYASEGRTWLRRALEVQDSASPIARARALVAAGSLATFQHDLDEASATLEAALAAWQAIGDPRGIGIAMLNRSHADLMMGNTARAEAQLRECHALFRAMNNDIGLASCLYRLGDLAATLGDLAQAQALAEESLTLGRKLGDDYRISSALHVLGHFAYMRGDLHAAAAQLHESLELSREVGDRRGIAVCMESVALVAGRRGHAERAARLFGAAARLRAATLAGRRIWIETTYMQGVDAARRVLGDSAYTAAAAAGGALPLSDAIAEALATLEPQSVTPDSAGALSQREREVALLVAQGRTNRQIGEALVITEGTAALHVKHALRKLNLTSRAALAAWATKYLNASAQISSSRDVRRERPA